jgi:hypothetical protein
VPALGQTKDQANQKPFSAAAFEAGRHEKESQARRSVFGHGGREYMSSTPERRSPFPTSDSGVSFDAVRE